MANSKIEPGILSIADAYETFFIDVYGVLFDGVNLYDRALATLEELKKRDKKVVILSNATQISSEAKIGYAKRGMIRGVHYDEFVTSGEFLHHTIKNNPEKFKEMFGGKADSVKCIFLGNANIFEETHLQKKPLKEADFVYVGVPRTSYGAVRIDDVWDCDGNRVNMEDVVDCDWTTLYDSEGRQGLAEFAGQLNICLSLEKPLLIANPDIFSHWPYGAGDSRSSIITQGAIGAYYEKLGGKVVYFGKPYPEIFEYARQSTDVRGQILMVGDTYWTDISGANACGLDSALVTETGAACEFLKRMDNSLSADEKFHILFEKIAPKMAKMTSSAYPTHFLE
jgi:ribonucleotide monophosphatase NagD (HAD superfamily)